MDIFLCVVIGSLIVGLVGMVYVVTKDVRNNKSREK